MSQSVEEQRIKIVIISDGTGETASAMVRAVMTQFEGKEIYFTRYKNIRSKDQLEAIYNQAAINHDLVVYTIVSSDLRKYAEEFGRAKVVRNVDLMGELLTALSNLTLSEPKSMPGLMHAVDDHYFKRMNAIEFTIHHDDGQNLESLHLADIVLVGLSRSSKTPLSMYLSFHGYKVVNVPLVPGTEINPEIYKIDQRKIFALKINAENLFEIRKNRLKGLGVTAGQRGEYADREKVVSEIEWVEDIYKHNKRWPVLDVTGKAVEETASEIMRLIKMREDNQFKQRHRFSVKKED